MENLKHPHIAQHIICPELEAQIKAAFSRNLENGTDYTATRFRQALDSYVASLITTPKGSSVMNDNLKDIKAHFCRGRKWVVIPSDNAHHQKAMDLAQSNGFDKLIELFEKNSSVHARFHSASSTGVNFSLHPNSSEASSIKFMIPTDDAMSLTVLDGTPKSCGLEGEKPKAKKQKKKAAPVQVDEEQQVDMTADLQSDEVYTEELNDEVVDQPVEGPSDEELMSEETSMEEWEQLLEAEGINLDFDEDSFDEEMHA